MSDLSLDRIKQIFRECDFEPRSYSGRCMYGARCLGIECSNPTSALLQVISYVAENCEDAQEVVDFIDSLGTPSQDNMGHDMIVYFQAIKWEDSPEEILEELLDSYGGSWAPGEKMLDGVRYEQSAMFDDEEAVDAFIEDGGIEVAARDLVRGRLTLFFNMPGRKAA